MHTRKSDRLERQMMGSIVWRSFEKINRIYSLKSLNMIM